MNTPTNPKNTPPPATASAAWRVTFDLRRCTWCMACLRVCDAGALRSQTDPSGARELFTIDASRCNGCGLCPSLCAARAIGVSAAAPLPETASSAAPPAQTTHPALPAAVAPRHIALTRHRCVQCRAIFRQLAAPTAGGNGAPAVTAPLRCPICQQSHKPQSRSGRIVQTG